MILDDFLPTPTQVAQPELAFAGLRCALRFLEAEELPASLADVERALKLRGYVLEPGEIRKLWARAVRAELAETRPHTRRTLLWGLLQLPPG